MEEFAALIAIDWADRQHAICLFDESKGAADSAVKGLFSSGFRLV
jgi:hypothetical protein